MIEVVEKFKGGAKGLPRDPNNGNILNVFTAGEKKFYILTPDDGFPVSRWTHYAKFNTMFMAAADMTNAYARRQKMDQMFEDLALQRNGVKLSDIIVANRSEMKEIQGVSEARFETGLYMATLFIVAEGEDVTKWSFAEAEEKIQAWADEGYGAQDFFVLAAHYVAAYMEILTNYLNVAAGPVAASTPSGTESTE